MASRNMTAQTEKEKASFEKYIQEIHNRDVATESVMPDDVMLFILNNMLRKRKELFHSDKEELDYKISASIGYREKNEIKLNSQGLNFDELGSAVLKLFCKNYIAEVIEKQEIDAIPAQSCTLSQPSRSYEI